MFVVTFVAQSQGLDLHNMLSLHSFGTPLFEPYQLISHFFMHGGITHIFFNMFVLISFGPFLERIWGAKRFAIAYLVSAFGAVLLYNGIGFYQIYELKQTIGNTDLIAGIDNVIRTYPLVIGNEVNNIALEKADLVINSLANNATVANASAEYFFKGHSQMLGASGAISGLMAGFAILFPNTELQLIFPPVRMKAKFLIGGYFVLDIILSIYQQSGDNVAHLAHVGGAIAGGILVYIWRKRSSNFY